MLFCGPQFCQLFLIDLFLISYAPVPGRNHPIVETFILRVSITAPALSKMFSLFCHKEEKDLPTTAYDNTSGVGPDPQDPHVFGPLGSGSISQR